MSPQTGQGGSQSIEDCGALSILFSSLSSKSEIPQRLQLFSDLRKERSTMVQSTSSILVGLEQEILRANPRHRLARTGIRTTEEHMEMLYRCVTLASVFLHFALRFFSAFQQNQIGIARQRRG
jgi:salicylate hydroxylase